MESNKELYKNKVIELLTNYKMSVHVNEFLENMVHVGFGVEQIKRNSVPFDYRFYSKNKEFLKKFIRELKVVSKNQDDVFSVVERENYCFISCKKKSFGCKRITVYT